MNLKLIDIRDNYLSIDLGILYQDFYYLWLSWQRKFLQSLQRLSFVSHFRKIFIKRMAELLFGYNPANYLFAINFLADLKNEKLGIEVLSPFPLSFVRLEHLYWQVMDKVIGNYSDRGKQLFIRQELKNSITYWTENKFLREYGDLIKLIGTIQNKDIRVELFYLFQQEFLQEIENNVHLFQQPHRNLFVQNDPLFVKCLEIIVLAEELPYEYQALIIAKTNILIENIIKAVDNYDELPTWKGRVIYLSGQALTVAKATTISLSLCYFLESIENKPAEYFNELGKLVKNMKEFMCC